MAKKKTLPEVAREIAAQTPKQEGSGVRRKPPKKYRKNRKSVEDVG